jgi:hypothetical protein
MTLSEVSKFGARDLEAALNRCLPRHEISVQATRAGDISIIVLLPDCPQCRGEGVTVVDALRAARQEFNHLLDCRVSWMGEATLTERWPRGPEEPQVRSRPLDGRATGEA